MNPHHHELTARERAQAFVQARQAIVHSHLGRVLRAGQPNLLQKLQQERAQIIASLPQRIGLDAAGERHLLAAYAGRIPATEIRKHALGEARALLTHEILTRLGGHAQRKRQQARQDLQAARQALQHSLDALDKLATELKRRDIDDETWQHARLWRGAGMEIVPPYRPATRAADATWTVVQTPYALQLSWLLHRLHAICREHIDYADSYSFHAALAQSAKAFGEPRPRSHVPGLCLAVLEQARKKSIASQQARLRHLQCAIADYTRIIEARAEDFLTRC